MAEPLKNIYNENFIDSFGNVLFIHLKSFDKHKFESDIFCKGWKDLELKERMRHITHVLHSILPKDYKNQIKSILTLIPELRKNGFKDDNLEFIFLPDFIACYGIDYPDVSLNAIKEVTTYVTCEFAIRPFLLKYPKKTITSMKKWSKANHWSVRRLASEGCRPRLPWAMGIPWLKKDPSVILSVLNNLKKDPSESVRRSVANNINDISKDHPELVIDMVKEWQSDNSNQMSKLLKHASRTLLKQGHPNILALFGYYPPNKIDVTDFSLNQKNIAIGDYLYFSFKILNKSTKPIKLRVEYKVYYQKANGTLSPKVYMIQEKEYASQQNGIIDRKQSFKQITTRKFHKGLHKIGILVNGVEKVNQDFQLI